VAPEEIVAVATIAEDTVSGFACQELITAVKGACQALSLVQPTMPFFL
jgi:hypothetical protein